MVLALKNHLLSVLPSGTYMDCGDAVDIYTIMVANHDIHLGEGSSCGIYYNKVVEYNTVEEVGAWGFGLAFS